MSKRILCHARHVVTPTVSVNVEKCNKSVALCIIRNRQDQYYNNSSRVLPIAVRTKNNHFAGHEFEEKPLPLASGREWCVCIILLYVYIHPIMHTVYWFDNIVPLRTTSAARLIMEQDTSNKKHKNECTATSMTSLWANSNTIWNPWIRSQYTHLI